MIYEVVAVGKNTDDRRSKRNDGKNMVEEREEPRQGKLKGETEEERRVSRDRDRLMNSTWNG